ncbi:PhnD/SsuA/transferrin family substrate-binding protein [Aquicoccus sp. SCR17]|nr:PhnD/SsuA/transferrin family substrate-binding protein [Carideicomes alvinocaridis]
MIAALPMYDHPAHRAATDRYWQLIRRDLPGAPDTLTRDRDPWELWLAPDLLLAQTCGFPYRARLHEKVTLVGTPDFGLEGCPPGHYRSVIVTRVGDSRDLAEYQARRLAYNEPLSQSGWAAPALHFARAGLTIGPVLRTGAHAASARAVAKGDADFAAIDARTWQILTAEEPVTRDLQVVAETEPAPGLPYITAAGQDPAPIRVALERAVADLAPADRETLGIRAIVAIPAAEYLAMPTPPPPPG